MYPGYIPIGISAIMHLTAIPRLPWPIKNNNIDGDKIMSYGFPSPGRDYYDEPFIYDNDQFQSEVYDSQYPFLERAISANNPSPASTQKKIESLPLPAAPNTSSSSLLHQVAHKPAFKPPKKSPRPLDRNGHNMVDSPWRRVCIKKAPLYPNFGCIRNVFPAKNLLWSTYEHPDKKS
jgi:hypothetical protein